MNSQPHFQSQTTKTILNAIKEIAPEVCSIHAPRLNLLLVEDVLQMYPSSEWLKSLVREDQDVPVKKRARSPDHGDILEDIRRITESAYLEDNKKRLKEEYVAQNAQAWKDEFIQGLIQKLQ